MRPIGICIVLGVVALEVEEGLVARVLVENNCIDCSLGFVLEVVVGVGIEVVVGCKGVG